MNSEKYKHVKQEPNHCVPACLESVAFEGGISISQLEIVSKFPDIFPNGALDDLNKTKKLNDVIRKIGLSENVSQIAFDLESLKEIIKENQILLMWSEPNHCVRLCEFNEDYTKAIVMDPQISKMNEMSIDELTKLSSQVVFFKKK